MPSGLVHDTVNLMFIIFASIIYFFLPYEYYLPFLVGFLLSTFFLSPDLDLSYSKSAKRWGIFKIFFYPYFFLSSHRGVSHTPILGTLIRYFYLIIVVLFIIFLYFFIKQILILKSISLDFKFFLRSLKDLKIFFESYFDFIVKYKNYIIFFLLGGICADLIHIILDRVSTYEKRKYARISNVKSNR